MSSLFVIAGRGGEVPHIRRGRPASLYSLARRLYSQVTAERLRRLQFTKMGKTRKMASRKGKTTEMRLVEAAATKQIAYLTKAEVERFFGAIPSGNARDQLLFDVIYRYGLRRTEAALIRREHLTDGRS